jgi:glycosyltransferase involved in cell wall biosynthesis
MKGAPHVLVLSPFCGETAALRLREALARQTWSGARLLLIDENQPQGEAANPERFSRATLAQRLLEGTFDYVFFCPEGVTLRHAAVEKLVLALHLAPEEFAVAERGRGIDAPWLARAQPALVLLALEWLDAPDTWTDALVEAKVSCFHIDENLTEIERPGIESTIFPNRPLRLKNFEPIHEEPLWTLDPAETEPDPDSILILTTSLPIGGACKFILDLATELKARGKRVMVATTLYVYGDPHPWTGEFLRVTDDVFNLSSVHRVELPRFVAHLARTRRCGRVLITHTMLGYLLLPWLRSQLPGVTFVDYTHIEYETEWPIGGYALRSVNNQSLLDLSLVSSQHLRGWMTLRGASPEKVRVCHTNIDTDRWTPSRFVRAEERDLLGIDEATTMILYPCRIVEQKRPEMLCNILAALRKATNKPFVLVVAGNGHLLPALKGFVQQHDLGAYVRTLGAVNLQRVARLHAAADIFLLPSLIEGIALALFEAMALESVPVVSDVGGQRELVVPECGCLIPITEPDREIPQYVTELKGLIEDPARRRRMAAAARARVVEHFPLRAMIDGFLAALDEADANRLGHPVVLPDAVYLRDVATLALDHVRAEQHGEVSMSGAIALGRVIAARDKTIEKLQRQLRDLLAKKDDASYALA